MKPAEHMTYVRYSPSPPLNNYIDYFYYLEGAMLHSRERILPTGWLDFEVNLGGAIHIYDASGVKAVATCVDSWWVGVWTTYGTVAWPSNIQLFGIHFKPGGAFPLLTFPLSEMHNQIVPADDIWGGFAADLREQIYSASTTQARFALLEQLMLARLVEPSHGLQSVRYAVAEITRRYGALSIRALSEYIGISQNHLLTLFKRMVGISPKALARLHRLKYVLHSINPAQSVNWTRIAHQADYYDQAHFVNDFKTFTGHRPHDYLQLRRQSYAVNPERDRLLHVLSTD